MLLTSDVLEKLNTNLQLQKKRLGLKTFTGIETGVETGKTPLNSCVHLVLTVNLLLAPLSRSCKQGHSSCRVSSQIWISV